MNILNLVLGIMLVLSGRKLFWLFVGGMGFVISFSLALQIFSGQPRWVLVLFSILIGIIGIFLTIYLEKAAVILGGFLAGAYLLASLVNVLNMGHTLGWLTYLVGGILGGLLVAALLEWSLIILSSLVGAVLVMGAVTIKPGLAVIAGFLIFLFGLGIQAVVMSQEGHPEP
jgi:hypothetical protein